MLPSAPLTTRAIPTGLQFNYDQTRLAYALYPHFIPGFDRNPSIEYSWNTAPAVPTDIWIGLANWELDRWDWFHGSASRRIDFPAEDAQHDYFTGVGGGILICVLQVGQDDNELDWLRVSSIPPQAQLRATPSVGTAPQQVQLDASGSSDPDGSIVEYEWDPQGDGSFEVSTGTDPLLNHNYDSVQEWFPAVRVTDSDGLSSVATTVVSLPGAELKLSLGAAGYQESIYRGIATEDGTLLLFGTRYQQGGDMQALVGRMTPGGTMLWAREWGSSGGFDYIYDAVLGEDGFIYTCGESSYGAGSTDGLVQKWDQQGELIWSKCFGTSYSDDFKAIGWYAGSLYLCGRYGTFDGSAQALCLQLSPAGLPGWARKYGGNWPDYFNDLVITKPLLADPVLHCCGIHGQSITLGTALYASIDSVSGTLSSSRTWDSVAYDETARSITAVGALTPIILISGVRRNASFDDQAWVSNPGGSSVVMTDSVAYLSGVDMYPLDGDTARCLFIRSFGLGEESAIVIDFGTNLVQQFGLALYFPLDPGCCDPLGLLRYPGAGVGVVGRQTGVLPEIGGYPADLSSDATAWEDQPLSTTSASLSSSDTPLELSDIEPLGRDRGQFDWDSFAYLDLSP